MKQSSDVDISGKLCGLIASQDKRGHNESYHAQLTCAEEIHFCQQKYPTRQTYVEACRYLALNKSRTGDVITLYFAELPEDLAIS